MRKMISQKTLLFLSALFITVSGCTIPSSTSSDTVQKGILPDGLKTGFYMGEKVYYSVENGSNLFQGDILIADHELSNTATRGAGMINKLWPLNTVYYVIDSNFPHSRQYIIHDAIEHWSKHTSLNFVASTTAKNRIRFKRHASSSNSYLGMIGGEQVLNLADWANTGTAIHEIGHAVGLFHEQSRSDRDNYIIIKWQNIHNNMEHNFRTFTASGYTGFNHGSFDFGSIMMYPAYTGDSNFAIDTSKPIITKKDGSTFSIQRSVLSQTDIETIALMYPGSHNIVIPEGSMYQLLLKGDYGVNIIPGDFNGDGKTDFIRQEKNGWDDDAIHTFSVYFSRGNGYFDEVIPPGDMYQEILRGDFGANIIPGDFNGDGKTDFIRQEKNGWDDDAIHTFSVYFSRGNGYFDEVIPPGYMYQEILRGDFGVNIIPGDFNGDGKTDFIRQEKNGWDDDANHTFSVYFSRGNGYFDEVIPPGYMYQEILKGDFGVNIIPGDFNGDGKTDFIRQEKNGWDDDAIHTFSVYFSRGNGYFDEVIPPGYMYQEILRGDFGVNIIPGDFNGDGKTDFIRQEKNGWDDDMIHSFSIYYSNGNGYFHEEIPKGTMYQDLLRGDFGVNLIPGDFNGDGKEDFIRQEKNSWDDNDINTFMIYFTR